MNYKIRSSQDGHPESKPGGEVLAASPTHRVSTETASTSIVHMILTLLQFAEKRG